MNRWIVRGRALAEDARPPALMGIVNATPDSFSDGGLAFALDAAVERCLRLTDEGADLLDVGGESSRPGAESVSVEEETRRVVPLIEAVRARIDIPISIDTAKPEVARRAVEAGASIVNDITALAHPETARLVAETDVGVVLMHMAGTPRTMQLEPRYDDPVADVRRFLESRIEALEREGIARERIAIDPGIGFGKTFEHNLALLRNLDSFASLGCALLIGTSRKSFLGTLTNRPVSERVVGSAVSALAAAVLGARVLRVHDVAATSDAIRVWGAIHGWSGSR